MFNAPSRTKAYERSWYLTTSSSRPTNATIWDFRSQVYLPTICCAHTSSAFRAQPTQESPSYTRTTFQETPVVPIPCRTPDRGMESTAVFTGFQGQTTSGTASSTQHLFPRLSVLAPPAGIRTCHCRPQEKCFSRVTTLRDFCVQLGKTSNISE